MHHILHSRAKANAISTNIVLVELRYRIVATTFLPLPLPPNPAPEYRNSARTIPCQVPSRSFPLDIGSVIELPTNEVFVWDTESLLHMSFIFELWVLQPVLGTLVHMLPG